MGKNLDFIFKNTMDRNNRKETLYINLLIVHYIYTVR